MPVTKFEIQNLKCHGCAKTIEDGLALIDGVSEINVEPSSNTVSLRYDTKRQLDEAVAKLSVLGYPLIGDNNPLSKKAKSYVSCAIGRFNT